MTTALTYLQFHLAFLVPAVLALTATGFVSRSHVEAAGAVRTDAGGVSGYGRRYWTGVAVVTLAALAYTIPWDNFLIAVGVWGYGEGATLATLGHAPIGEYLFILVQPWVTALWLSHLSIPSTWADATGDQPIVARAVGVTLAAGIGIAGWAMLGTDATFYLGAIAAWAAPVLALQWAVGAPQLWARRRLVALATLVPALYLSVVDRAAIALDIWILSEQYTTGIEVAGLPVEEGAFFLVTNLFVVQGLVLFRWVVDRWIDGDAPLPGRPSLRPFGDRR
ncbi:lycopene cyclase domain-containing protein [Halobaculum gomorrense]|uniref:Lycopene cyclase domain-containing protein n=1 Tax=Halobaculum gomorrense TaxID=43928 RepID=A0A1M5UEB8_9EURY|nr:lycopene cyclase domain-containing protein [Halobaculum gomorrense]SHH61309.1 lycopene cyclase domain-containing protein [Halobaculum gomorrense]